MSLEKDLEDFFNKISRSEDHLEKASNAFVKAEGSEDPIVEIKADLLLGDKPRQIPLIKTNDIEEAKKKVENGLGELMFEADLEDYLFNG